MQEEIFVECKEVSVGYKEQSAASVVVKNRLSIKALRGEMVALVGGNGVGKSTLLRTIAGLQPLLSGELLLHRKSVASFAAAELSRELSFVSTENIHVANLTVRELVGLGRYPYTDWFGRMEERDHLIVDKVIRQVGLSGYENRLINRISDGERHRAMIARALAQDTRIVILDEPTAFLDIANKYEIVHILYQLAKEEGKCIIFSTHDLNTALSMADRIWLMLDHCVVEGIPEELAAGGYFEALFPNSQYLFFDAEKGDFRIRREKLGIVLLTAKDPESKSATKALERIGFEVVTHTTHHSTSSSLEPTTSLNQISVSQQANGWSLNYAGLSKQIDSLEELCRELKKLTPPLGS